MTELLYRSAVGEDAAAIAALHADSWRRHYRGAMTDAYLDGPIDEERLAVWTERLAAGGDGVVTIVVELAGDPELIGFAHTILDDEPEWGALLDNLHVRFDHKGSGIGAELLARTAEAVVARRPGSGLFLWVLEQNVAARGFYERQGGVDAGIEDWHQPDGGVTRSIRVVWPDPSTLVRS